MNHISKKDIVLFKEKRQCCACGACENICPKQAISMKEDRNGFLYPRINHEICIKCGLCNKVCEYQNNTLLNNESQVAYAAIAKKNDLLMKSASGGLFAVIAETILEKQGIVYGAALINESNNLVPKHIRIDAVKDLEKLQGSKYVQSSIELNFKQVEKDLKDGKLVLFSGTPCQIAGLYGYLGKKYNNLYTIDIICHGVPSSKFFQSYITELMKKWNGHILDFKFRDKTNGWGLNAKVSYLNKNGKIKIKRIPAGASSYFDMFLKSETYRINCYSCPYANKKRMGDITLGDYWGIQKEHPELMEEAGGNYSDNKGISCILVNNNQGKALVNLINNKTYINISTVEKVAKGNGQLKKPSQYPRSRDEILGLYVSQGYNAVEQYFKKRTGVKIQYYYLKNILPHSFKKNIKKIVTRK